MEINSEAKKVIYQYAEIVDSRSFDQLDSIMWSDFSMTGGYELNGIEGFMGAMDYLVSTYTKTMHLIGNIDGSWDGDIYKGKTYCIASHIFEENGQIYEIRVSIKKKNSAE